MRPGGLPAVGLGCALSLSSSLWLATSVPGAGEVRPGAYCPLPEAGEKPKCLEPAVDRYGGFFEALDGGEPSDAAVARVESDFTSGEASERAYLALSSLAYGYYRLAQQAAATPGEDPAIVARLERWNGLLSNAYASSEDPAYREALRSAARDLDEHSDVLLECVDATGATVPCRSTEVLLRGLDRTGSEVGLRGAVRRLLQRMFGAGDS